MKKIIILLVVLTCMHMFSLLPVLAEEETPTPQTITLEIGEMQVYDFGDIKLHAYKTNDPLSNESFILETADALIGIESPCFESNLAEYLEYINALAKPMHFFMLPYHPAGAQVYEEGMEFAGTRAAKAAQSEGGAVKGLVDSFIEIFGEGFNGSIPEITSILEPGIVTLEGVDFVITETADGFDMEIPALHAVFTHMFGADVHNILVSEEAIDTMIAQVKTYQEKAYALILSSHDSPETQEAAAEKLVYLQKVKQLAAESDNAEAFMSAMKEAFPNYSGDNYLEMSAGALFP